MKKIFFMLIMASLIAGFHACNNNEASTTSTPASSPAAAAGSVNTSSPDYKKGLELVAKSDCLTCHKVEQNMVGPSYRSIADKYENTPGNISMLAGKIIKGGHGNWGEVPMTPHPDVSTQDAEQMVKYIMLLKKK